MLRSIALALLLSAITQASKLPCNLSVSFYLWNAETNTLMHEIFNGDLIPHQSFDLSVEARTACKLFRSMRILVKGNHMDVQRTENVIPYMAFGDNTRGNVNGRSFRTGTYKVTAVAFGEKYAKGPAVSTTSVEFSIVDQLPPPLLVTPVTSAPVSAAPVSAAPVSAAPVSAAPVSAAPVSAAPVSAAPVSAAPVSAAPVSAAPVSAAPVAAMTTVTPVATMTQIPVASATRAPVNRPTQTPVAAPVVSPSVSSATASSEVNPLVGETNSLCPCWDEKFLNATFSSVPWTSITSSMNTYQSASLEKPSWLSVEYGTAKNSFELTRYGNGSGQRTCSSSINGVMYRLPESAYAVCKSNLMAATERHLFQKLRKAAGPTCSCYSNQTLGTVTVKNNVFSMVTPEYAVQDYRESLIRFSTTDSIPSKTEPTCSLTNYGGRVVDATRTYEIAPVEFHRCHMHHIESFVANAETLL